MLGGRRFVGPVVPPPANAGRPGTPYGFGSDDHGNVTMMSEPLTGLDWWISSSENVPETKPNGLTVRESVSPGETTYAPSTGFSAAV